MTSFAVTFSSAGLLAAVLAPLILWAALVAVLRLVPPALKAPGLPERPGFAFHALLLFLACEASLLLFDFGRSAGEVAGVIAIDADYAGAALPTLIPSGLSAFGISVSLLLLTLGRSPGALYGAVAALWVAGPVADLLASPLLGVPFDATNDFFGVSALTVVATIYLLFSRAANLFYGTTLGQSALRAAQERARREEDRRRLISR